MIDLSFVIVTWNCCDYLKACLESVHATVHAPFEIIVVDNASSDSTVDMVRSRFPTVRVIANDVNVGFAKANNLGIAASSGRLLVLMNPDVVLLDGCIDRALRSLGRDGSIALVGPRMLAADGSTQRSAMRLPTLGNLLHEALALHLVPSLGWSGGRLMRDSDWNNASDVEVLNGWLWVVRREAVDEVGTLDERFFMYGEDLDWCKRFRTAGWRMLYEPSASAIHYGGGSSRQAPLRFFLEMQRARRIYWSKHHSRASQLAFGLILIVHHGLRSVGYGILSLGRSAQPERWYKCLRSVACLQWLVFGTSRHLR